jgi:hypothetical protein
MQNRSPIFYGILIFVGIIVVVMVGLIIKDAFYFGRLLALESNGQTTVGRLLVPGADTRRTDSRDIPYIFEVNGVQYRGSALDDGQSNNNIAVRYLATDPSANLPALVNIPSEKGLALLRIGVMAGFMAIGAVSYLILRRR